MSLRRFPALAAGAFLLLAPLALAAPTLASELPESVRWLQEYVQIDTTNPPGGEGPAVEYLAAILERSGLESRRLESPEGRPSLYARYSPPGSRGRAILLTHHLDVVPAGEPWQSPAFSGRLHGGKLWGRGAIDAKGLGIAQLAAILALKETGLPLGRDLVFLAVADEELGGLRGTGWLVEAHPELFADVDVALNEGGANRAIGDRLIWWGIEVAQKRPLWLEVTATARGGHGSTLLPGSATHQLIEALARLIDEPLRFRSTPAARLYLEAVVQLEGGATLETFERLEEVLASDDPLERLPAGWPTVLVDTVQVTEISNGAGRNVISPMARAYVDVRLLPDTDADAFLARVKEVLGEGVEVEVVLASPPVPEPPDLREPFYRALAAALEVRAPVVPVMISGITDSRYLRRLGVPTYGFNPFALGAEDLRGVHAVDEAMPVDAFLRGIETLRRLLVVLAER